MFLLALFFVLDSVTDVECFQAAGLSTHQQILQELGDALIRHSITTDLEVADLCLV